MRTPVFSVRKDMLKFLCSLRIIYRCDIVKDRSVSLGNRFKLVVVVLLLVYHS